MIYVMYIMVYKIGLYIYKQVLVDNYQVGNVNNKYGWKESNGILSPLIEKN